MDRGAHTVIGAPLIPPNQHLFVKIEKQTGQPIVHYEVRADDPDYDAYQVFLEQGVGIAFDYGGLQPALLGLLSVALKEVDPDDMEDEVENLEALRKDNPSKYDETVRLRFHEFYPKIRFFHEPDVKANVQQSPEQGGDSDDTDLETL